MTQHRPMLQIENTWMSKLIHLENTVFPETLFLQTVITLPCFIVPL